MSRIDLSMGLAIFAFAMGNGCKKSEEPEANAPAALTEESTKAAAEPAAAAPEATDATKPKQTCDECRALYCSKYEEEGLDMARGCWAPDPKYVPAPDANFARDCKAVLECAYKHDCAYDAARGPAPCYCGSIRPEPCVKDGPAADAPCVAEWKAATRSEDNAVVVKRFSDLHYPAGWAFHLLECDRVQCNGKYKRANCLPEAPK